jgi:hypothetical protein
MKQYSNYQNNKSRKKYGGNNNIKNQSLSAEKATDNFVEGIINISYENENYSEFCRTIPISEGIYLKDLFNNIETCEAFLISTKGIVSFFTELFKEGVSSNEISKLRGYLEQRCNSNELQNPSEIININIKNSQDNSLKTKLLNIIDRVINKTKLMDTISKTKKPQENKIYTEMENNLQTSDEAANIYRHIFSIYFGLVPSTPEKCKNSKKIIRLFFLLRSLIKNQNNIKTQYFVKINSNSNDIKSEIEKNQLSLLLYVIYNKLMKLIINFLPEDNTQNQENSVNNNHLVGGAFKFFKPTYKIINFDLNKYKNDIIRYRPKLDGEKIPIFEINQKNKARIILNIGLYGIFTFVLSVGSIGSLILPIPLAASDILYNILKFVSTKTAVKLQTIIYSKNITPKRPAIKNSNIINNDNNKSIVIIDDAIQDILEHIPLNIRALMFIISSLCKFPEIDDNDMPIYSNNKYNYGKGDLIFNTKIYSEVQSELPKLEEVFTKNNIKFDSDKPLGEILNTYFFTNIKNIQYCIPWYNEGSLQNCDNNNNITYNLDQKYTNLDKKILPDTYFGNIRDVDDIFNKLNSHNASNIDIILKEIQVLMKNIYINYEDKDTLTDNQKIRLDLTFKLINLLIDEIRLLSKIYVLLINDYMSEKTNKVKILESYLKYSKNNYLKKNNQYYTFLFNYLYNNKITINNYKVKFNEIENILNNKNEKVNSIIDIIYKFMEHKIVEPINRVINHSALLEPESAKSQRIIDNRPSNINLKKINQPSLIQQPHIEIKSKKKNQLEKKNKTKRNILQKIKDIFIKKKTTQNQKIENRTLKKSRFSKFSRFSRSKI